MFVKVHESYRNVIAICDENLIGGSFEEGKMQIDVKENFYMGEKKTGEEVRKIIEDGRIEDTTFNIVGEESVNLALELNVVNKEGIKTVQGIPVALILA